MPLPFCINAKRSLNPRGYPCYLVNPGPSGLDKRQFTLQLTLRADGQQLMPPYLLFRGVGEITPEERAALDECSEIRCVWQNKAWADGKLSRAWLRDFTKITSTVPGNHLLFLDELPEDAKGRGMKSYECGIFCDTK